MHRKSKIKSIITKKFYIKYGYFKDNYISLAIVFLGRTIWIQNGYTIVRIHIFRNIFFIEINTF